MSNQKVAIVTGSAVGLGNAIATRLAEDGFKIVLHDINEENLNKAKSVFDEKGFEYIAVKGDVASRQDQFDTVKKR